MLQYVAFAAFGHLFPSASHIQAIKNHAPRFAIGGRVEYAPRFAISGRIVERVTHNAGG